MGQSSRGFSVHSAIQNLKPRPLLLRPRPLYRALLVQTRISHTSHKSRVTASILALLVAQAIRWHYSASVWSRRFVVAFEMVWGGCNPCNPPPRSAHEERDTVIQNITADTLNIIRDGSLIRNCGERLWYRVSLAKPDPYVGGEGLVNCYISSCTAASYTAVPIRFALRHKLRRCFRFTRKVCPLVLYCTSIEWPIST